MDTQESKTKRRKKTKGHVLWQQRTVLLVAGSDISQWRRRGIWYLHGNDIENRLPCNSTASPPNELIRILSCRSCCRTLTSNRGPKTSAAEHRPIVHCTEIPDSIWSVKVVYLETLCLANSAALWLWLKLKLKGVLIMKRMDSKIAVTSFRMKAGFGMFRTLADKVVSHWVYLMSHSLSKS